MHTVNEIGTKKIISSQHIFFKDPEKMGCPITFHLTFKPQRLIARSTTIQNGESGSLLTITFLDGESFPFYHRWWEQREDTLEMIWPWESEEIFDKLQLLATKLIELTVGEGVAEKVSWSRSPAICAAKSVSQGVTLH